MYMHSSCGPRTVTLLLTMYLGFRSLQACISWHELLRMCYAFFCTSFWIACKRCLAHSNMHFLVSIDLAFKTKGYGLAPFESLKDVMSITFHRFVTWCLWYMHLAK